MTPNRKHASHAMFHLSPFQKPVATPKAKAVAATLVKTEAVKSNPIKKPTNSSDSDSDDTEEEAPVKVGHN